MIDTTLTFYKGRIGKKGSDGINGVNSSEIDSNSVSSPLVSALLPNKTTEINELSIDRGSIGTYVDRYGNNKFSTTVELINYCKNSEYFSQWNDPLNVTTFTGNTTDPLGGNKASLITLDANTNDISGPIAALESEVLNVPPENYKVISVYVKRVSGSCDSLSLLLGGSYYDLGSISDEWQRKSIKLYCSGNLLFGFTPRGDTGAVIALYGAQVEMSYLDRYTITISEVIPVKNDYPILRTNEKGYLVEGEKQNLIYNSQDFRGWEYNGGVMVSNDAFGNQNSLVQVYFSSLSVVTATTTTSALVEGQSYKLSFYAFLQGGSLSSLNCSLGGGESVELELPSVLGYNRIFADVIAGPDNTFSISFVSDPRNAIVNICCWQIEEGAQSSYIESSTGGTRNADIISMAHDYNAPNPITPWAFLFFNRGFTDGVIYTNGESGTGEFTIRIDSNVITVNSGGNTESASFSGVLCCGLTYDGTNIYFYGDKKLIKTALFTSTGGLSTVVYIGSNNGLDSINGHISNFTAYNRYITQPNIEYLMGE